MKEIFKVSTKLTKDILYEIGIYVSKRDNFKDRLLLSIVSAVTIGGITWYLREITLGAILLAVFSIIGIWKVEWFSGYIYMKRHEKSLETQTILFYKEYFEIEYEETKEEYECKYSDIKKVEEIEKAFLIIIGESILWIDKKAFIKEDLDKFRCFIKEKVSSSSVKIK